MASLGTEVARDAAPAHRENACKDAEKLVATVQELSLARSLDDVTRIVRSAARALSGADGATFVLREGDSCFYADEDSIAPLWKGRRFPMSACISGWTMLHGESARIEDIYADPRIPAEAYRPTYVRSLAMVPIRTSAPIGAIGNYWARPHLPTSHELRLLQALADSTSIALENVDLYRSLEDRVVERTSQLRAANAALARKNEELHALQRQKEELSALIVHDIKGPAAAIKLRAELQLRRSRSPEEAERWRSVLAGADRINRMALDLLDMSSSESGVLVPRIGVMHVPALFSEIVSAFEAVAASRQQCLVVAIPTCDVELHADEELVRRVLFNLVDNSLRYAKPGDEVQVEVRTPDADTVELVVADTGPGIPPEQRERIFEKYVRLDGGVVDGAAAAGPGARVGVLSPRRGCARWSDLGRRQRATRQPLSRPVAPAVCPQVDPSARPEVDACVT